MVINWLTICLYSNKKGQRKCWPFDLKNKKKDKTGLTQKTGAAATRFPEGHFTDRK
jgi:hypothetical protein